MLMIPIILLCVVIGIKCSLLTQAIFLVCIFIGIMTLIVREGDLQDIFVAGIIVWIMMLSIVGIGIGDIYYYNTYYTGNQTLWGLLSWLWKP